VHQSLGKRLRIAGKSRGIRESWSVVESVCVLEPLNTIVEPPVKRFQKRD